MEIKFEMSGLDELGRELNRLSDNAQAMDGEHAVPLTELCSPAFMAAHTEFGTLEELFEASGFTVETPEDFAAIPDEDRDAFIARVTEFQDWKTMQEKAAADWIARGQKRPETPSTARVAGQAPADCSPDLQNVRIGSARYRP